MKFNVTLTVIYNGSVTVEADSMEEALNIADAMVCDGECTFPSDANIGDIPFTFGEVSIDYAEEE